jgi:flagellar biogenesis protein FliO
MAETTQIQPTETPAKTNWFKVGLAWAISLLFIFIVIYVASRAWKKGQVNG